MSSIARPTRATSGAAVRTPTSPTKIGMATRADPKPEMPWIRPAEKIVRANTSHWALSMRFLAGSDCSHRRLL